MKIPAIAALLVSLLVLPGCIYVPPVWDIGDAINDVEWIKPGVTTKAQVVERLGEPDGIDGERIIYRGNSSDGFISLTIPYTAQIDGLIGERLWSIYIDIDAAGVVWQLTKLEPESREERAYQLRVEAANEGDPKAQFDFYIDTASGNQAWLWLCRSANGGYSLAQDVLGNHYETGREPAPQDHVEAYKWYTLAHASGHSAADLHRNKLVKTMTSEQTSRAKKLVTKWKPDPASCEGNYGDTLLNYRISAIPPVSELSKVSP